MSAAEFRRAAERRYKQTCVMLSPQVREALAKTPLMSADYAIAINVSQNVLREAMEAVFQNAVPQPRGYFCELAVRLACYAITSLHPDDQEVGAMMVKDGILNKLADMQANGHVIKTEWE